MTVLVNIKAKKKFDFTLGYIEEKKIPKQQMFFFKDFSLYTCSCIGREMHVCDKYLWHFWFLTVLWPCCDQQRQSLRSWQKFWISHLFQFLRRSIQYFPITWIKINYGITNLCLVLKSTTYNEPIFRGKNY